MTTEEIEFLTESNAIEGVYDEISLQQAGIAWEFLLKNPKLTPSVILKTHKILMLHSKLYPNEKGYFRTIPVYVNNQEKIEWGKIDQAIKRWCWKLSTIKNFNPKNKAQRIKELHIDYENIHPFVDGNGRTGRMFLNWQRLKEKLPLLIIHANTPEHEEYYTWFNE